MGEEKPTISEGQQRSLELELKALLKKYKGRIIAYITLATAILGLLGIQVRSWLLDTAKKQVQTEVKSAVDEEMEHQKKLIETLSDQLIPSMVKSLLETTEDAAKKVADAETRLKALGSKMDTFDEKIATWTETLETYKNLAADFEEQREAITNVLEQNQVAIAGLKNRVERVEQKISLEDLKVFRYQAFEIVDRFFRGLACFVLTEDSFERLKEDEMPKSVLESLKSLQDQAFCPEAVFWEAVQEKIGEAEKTDYQKRILKYANFEPVDDITFNKAEKLRQDIIEALEKGIGAKMIVTPNSIFDKDADPEVVRNEFTPYLRAIIDYQDEIYSRIGYFYDTIVPITANHLKELMEDERFKTRIKGSTKFKGFSPNKANDLADCSKTIPEEEAVPLETEGKDVDLTEAWEGSDLDRCIERLERTIQTLDEELGKFVSDVSTVSTSASPEVSGAPTTNEQKSLEDLVERSIRDLQSAHEELESMQKILEIRTEAINDYIEQLGSQVRTDITVVDTSVEEFETPHGTEAEFGRALVTANKPGIQANFTDNTTVTVYLPRDLDTIAERSFVTFSATDVNGNPFGFFSNITPSNEQGEATAVFTAGDNASPGTATITAVVQGTAISGTTKIEILPLP